MSSGEVCITLVVVAAFILFGWVTSLKHKAQMSEYERRILLRKEFDRMKPVIERTYSHSETGGPAEVKISGEGYRAGDRLLDPLYATEDEDGYLPEEGDFMVSEIVEPPAGSTVWRIRILDYGTKGELFDTTIMHDEMMEREEDV